MAMRSVTPITPVVRSTQAVDALLSPGAGSLPGGCPPAPVVWAHDNRSRSAAETHHPAVDGESLAGDPADGLDQHRALLGLDPLVQRLDRVVLEHRHGRLGDDRAGVDTVIDDEERAAGDLHAVLQRLG